MPRSPRWRSILRAIGPIVLGVGIVVFLVVRFAGQGSNDKPIPPAQNNVPVAAQGNPAWLTPEVSQVTKKFVLTAVTRKNLAESWPLLDETFPGKADFTRRTWSNPGPEGLPVIPASYPITSPSEIKLSMGPSTRNELTVEVLLVPKKGRAEAFEIGLHNRGTTEDPRWLVDYWNTRYRPGVLAEPK
jgi:hypothetical protein